MLSVNLAYFSCTLLKIQQVREPASRSSFGTGQVRKSEERPLNQPSQYFSVLDSSTRQVNTLSFLTCVVKKKSYNDISYNRESHCYCHEQNSTSWSSSFIRFLLDDSSSSSSASSSITASPIESETPGLLQDSSHL